MLKNPQTFLQKNKKVIFEPLIDLILIYKDVNFQLRYFLLKHHNARTALKVTCEILAKNVCVFLDDRGRISNF